MEASVTARLGEHLDFGGSYTFTDSTQPQAQGGHEDELRRPRHMAAADLN